LTLRRHVPLGDVCASTLQLISAEFFRALHVLAVDGDALPVVRNPLARRVPWADGLWAQNCF